MAWLHWILFVQRNVSVFGGFCLTHLDNQEAFKSKKFPVWYICTCNLKLYLHFEGACHSCSCIFASMNVSCIIASVCVSVCVLYLDLCKQAACTSDVFVWEISPTPLFHIWATCFWLFTTTRGHRISFVNARSQELPFDYHLFREITTTHHSKPFPPFKDPYDRFYWCYNMW